MKACNGLSSDWLIEAALKVNRAIGSYVDYSVAYLKEKGNDGIGLINSIIESARDNSLTFPGMLNFGSPIINKKNSIDFSEDTELAIKTYL